MIGPCIGATWEQPIVLEKDMPEEMVKIIKEITEDRDKNGLV